MQIRLFLRFVSIYYMKEFRCILAFVFLLSIPVAGSCLTSDSLKNIPAMRLSGSISVDGKLSEQIWINAEKATSFIQTEPVPGKPSSFNTEVAFVYDNNAVYIGAKLFDPEPEKILHEMSLRDDIGNADNFGVFIDSYKSGLNGFMFYVTASGIQLESVVTNNDDDTNWNAIWESAVSIDEQGWNVEIRIPYSALRFPAGDDQEWKVQFTREIRRFRETSFWSPIDPTIAGWVQQSGLVRGIKNIKSPVRLSLTPYVSGYLNTTFDPASQDNKWTSGTAYSAGLDLKYGINDGFTLDMTLIPDFGQVISDKKVLNLGPFEVFFAENRQFFTEGTELFNKGQMFYSRRIGGQPLHYYDVYSQLRDGENVISNPETTQLYNATKISGRTSKGTGIGFFNAIVGEQFATLRHENGAERRIKTNPITNYNALVVDQNLKNNSFVSIMNSNVYRLGEDYDANTTGTFFTFKTKDQKYFVSGNGILSRQFYEENTVRGHTYNISLGKASGNWTYEAGHGLESDQYDPNDLGFLYSPNEKYYYVSGGYNQFKPKNPKLQQYSINAFTNYARLYKPDVFNDFSINVQSFVLFKSRFAFGLNTRLEPFLTYDYFEPRTPDFSRFLTWPKNYRFGGFVSSDYRKPFAFDMGIGHRFFINDVRKYTNITFDPRLRFSDKFSLFFSTAISDIKHEPGYVNRYLTQSDIPGLGQDDILMGVRNRLIIENSVSGRYIFNSLMGINLRIRHYWDKVRYQHFGRLDEEGFVYTLPFDGKDRDGNPVYDRNVNIFNIDMQYNWRFAPGSDIIIVWKNQIFSSDAEYSRDYLQNLSGLFGSLQTNNFSVRVLYYLDYLYLFPRKNQES